MTSSKYKLKFKKISLSSAMTIKEKPGVKRHKVKLKKHDIKNSFKEVGKIIGECIEQKK